MKDSEYAWSFFELILGDATIWADKSCQYKNFLRYSFSIGFIAVVYFEIGETGMGRVVYSLLGRD